MQPTWLLGADALKSAKGEQPGQLQADMETE